jgi:hypothetical protein
MNPREILSLADFFVTGALAEAVIPEMEEGRMSPAAPRAEVLRKSLLCMVVG